MSDGSQLFSLWLHSCGIWPIPGLPSAKRPDSSQPLYVLTAFAVNAKTWDELLRSIFIFCLSK